MLASSAFNTGIDTINLHRPTSAREPAARRARASASARAASAAATAVAASRAAPSRVSAASELQRRKLNLKAKFQGGS